MGYSIFQETVSDLLETLSYGSENRVYRPAGSISGKDLAETFKNGVRPVNLVPYSYMGGANPLTSGAILEPTGISEYFTREVVEYSASARGIKYTCIKDVPKDTEVLIFDSGNEYPSHGLEYPMLIILYFTGRCILKDGSYPTIRLSVTDLTTDTEIISGTSTPVSDFRLFSRWYTRSYFQPSEVRISAKTYLSGNIVVGDVIEVPPPVMIGINPFKDFSRVDEIAAIEGEYTATFSGTLEEYSAQNLSSKMGLSKNQTIDILKPVSFEDALMGSVLTEKEAES